MLCSVYTGGSNGVDLLNLNSLIFLCAWMLVCECVGMSMHVHVCEGKHTNDCTCM